MTVSAATVTQVDLEHLGTPCYIEQSLPLLISLAEEISAFSEIAQAGNGHLVR